MPAEWGAVLYQPPWADRYRVGDEEKRPTGQMLFGSLGVFVPVSLFLVLELAFNWRFPPTALASFLVLLLVLLVLALLLYFLWQHYTHWPLRVWEAGVTLPRVNFRQGLRGEQVLVPFNKVKGLRMGTRRVRLVERSQLEMEHWDDGGELVTVALDNWHLKDDLFPLLSTLERKVPRLLDEHLRDLLASKTLDIGPPERFDWSLGPVRYAPYPIMSFSILVCSIFGASFLELMGPSPAFAVVFLIIVLGWTLCGPFMVFLWERKQISFLLAFNAAVTDEGWAFDLKGWRPAYLLLDNPVPFGRVARVDLRLGPLLHRWVQLTLTNGQEFVQGAWVFEGFRRHSGFREGESSLVNDAPPADEAPRLPSPDWRRLALASDAIAAGGLAGTLLLYFLAL